MKIKSAAAFTGGALYLVVGTLLLASGSANAHNVGTKKQVVIKFKVGTNSEGNPALVVTKQDFNHCTNHPEYQDKGCFRLEKDTSGLIKFRLKKDDFDDGWTLRQFTICRDPNETDEAPGKIETSCNGSSLSIEERLEFFIMDDKRGTTVLPTPESGVVDLSTGLGNNLQEFYVVDQNTIEQVYFYNIQACKTGSPDPCVYLDPPVENTGRN